MLGCGKRGGDSQIGRDAPSVCTVAALDIISCLYLASLRYCDCGSSRTHESEYKLLIKHSRPDLARVTTLGHILYAAVCGDGDKCRAVLDLD